MDDTITRRELTAIMAEACAGLPRWQRWLLMRVARRTGRFAYGTFEYGGVGCPWKQAHLPAKGASRFYTVFDVRMIQRPWEQPRLDHPWLPSPARRGSRVLTVTD